MLINSSSSTTSSPSSAHKYFDTATTNTPNKSKSSMAKTTSFTNLTSSSSNNISTTTNKQVNNNNLMISTYSASYSNLKQSSPTITRQSSNLTYSHSTHLNNTCEPKPLHIHQNIKSVQTVSNNHPTNNTNYSQNNPKTLNSASYNAQSTINSPPLANKVAISKPGNFQNTTPISIVSNSSTTLDNTSNNSSSIQLINRQNRSQSNGSDISPTPIQTNLHSVNTMKSSNGLRGLAISTSSLTALESKSSMLTPKLPPLSFSRLEKSTSDSSLENLHFTNQEPATPRVVNIDKYFKFAQLVMDEEACEVFLEFLRKKRNEENLEFILQVSALKKIPSLNNVTAIEILQRIRSDFLTIGSMYELNVSKQVKSLSIERIDRCLQHSITSSQSSSNFASSPVLSLQSSPSTVSSLTCSTTVPSVDNSYGSPTLISSSFSSMSLLHSSPRDNSESCTILNEIPLQPITTSTILKEIELEVRLQLQNESFKEFKASDEFEHFLLTKVIEQSQSNNPVNNASPMNSPHLTESTNSSRSDKSNNSVGSPQTGGFFSKIFKKKATVQEPKSDDSITDDEMSVGSGESDYIYNPQNPNDITFVENLQIRKWNNQQVINFFKYKLDLPEYTDAIKKNEIKGVDLSLLKKDDIPDQATEKIDTSELQKKVDGFFKKIKMSKLGHKKKLQREVNEAIIAYQRKQQKSSTVSSLEPHRKVSDSVLPKSQISSTMEADLTTIIIKLWITPSDQKRVFTVKRCIKLDRLKSIIQKEVSDITEKKYPSENPAMIIGSRSIKTSKGDSLSNSEKLYQYLCTESTNSQFVTLKIEL